jgi:hypothetical protein
MTARRGYTIFCDDVRHELGGKITLVGVYRSEMLVHGKLPIVLPKLGIAILLQTPVEGPFQRLKLMIYMPGDDEKAPSFSGELELAQQQAPSDVSEADDHWLAVNSEIVLSSVKIKQEGYIRVLAVADGEPIRIGALRVREATARATAAAKP